MELDIAYFSKLIGDVPSMKKFYKSSLSRRETLKSVFWNDEMGQWLDYWLSRDGDCEVGTFQFFHFIYWNCQRRKISGNSILVTRLDHISTDRINS